MLNSPPSPRDLPPEISVVVPLFNEQENVDALYRRIRAALDSLHVDFEIILVNDGSRDATAARIETLQADDPQLVALHLSRNFGHQAAVTAGLDHARGRAVVVLDGDLQDPPELIPEFARLWRTGNDVVYAVRKNRQEHLLKRGLPRLLSRLECDRRPGNPARQR